MTTTRRNRTSKRTVASAERPQPNGAAKTVRWSRVLSAQARIAAGYYELEEVRESVVDALLEELARR